MYSHRKKALQTELELFEFKHPFGPRSMVKTAG
jgi:hypothetical protein